MSVPLKVSESLLSNGIGLHKLEYAAVPVSHKMTALSTNRPEQPAFSFSCKIWSYLLWILVGSWGAAHTCRGPQIPSALFCLLMDYQIRVLSPHCFKNIMWETAMQDSLITLWVALQSFRHESLYRFFILIHPLFSQWVWKSDQPFMKDEVFIKLTLIFLTAGC